MPVYKDTVYDKSILWWTCPFCDKTITAVKPNSMDIFARCHLENHCEEVSRDDLRVAICDLWGYCVLSELTDKILIKAVLDKL